MFNENSESYRVAKTRELGTDISCDYVLPDYLGEVRKILFTEARVIPLPTYVNGEDACLSGTVHFKMVYADSENRLSTAEFSEDYDIREHLAEQELMAVSAVTELDGYSMRLLGPRKISAKARVLSRLTTVGEAKNELGGNAAEAGELELAKKAITVRECVVREAAEREYADELAFLEGVISDEVEIPYKRVDSAIHECRAKDGEIWLAGEHLVTSLIKCGGEPVYSVKKSIPFAESFASEGVREGMQLSAVTEVTSLKISENPSETGTSVTVAMVAEYSAVADGNGEACVYTDGYMRDREVEATYSNLEVEELLCGSLVSERVETAVDLAELSLDGARELLAVSAEAKIKSVEVTDVSLKISTDVRFSGVACEINDDSAVGYLPVKHTTEHTAEIPLNYAPCDCVRPEISLRVFGADGYVDGNTLSVSAALNIDYKIYGQRTHKVLTSLGATDEMFEPSDGRRVTVYYPDGEDTLFSVARKFHTTTERVAMDNSLTEAAVADGCAPNSLCGVTKLIIK